MTKLRLFLLFLVSLACIAAPVLQGTAKADAFNQNNIISNAVFENNASLTAAQVDNFLNSFPNSCISTNSGFAAVDPTGYNPTNGFSYGGYVSAGQVIYDTAQAYGINPQVLLATLQKEQSLVAGGAGFCENGGLNKYAAAVGYGCPDSGGSYSYSGISLYRRNGTVISSVSGTCVNSADKAGFSQQLIRAAWLFRFGEERSQGNINWAVIKGSWNNSDDPTSCYGGPMTQGTFQRCPSGATVYYDGYTTIDNSAVHMDNGATAALYWYTPHFSGNQNFFNIFTGWFGTTHGTIILTSPSSQTFYLLNNGQKLAIPTAELYHAYGFDKIATTTTSDAYLNNLPSGNNLSNLARDANGNVQLVTNGHRYTLTSGVCTAWGFQCSNPYIVNTLDSYPLSFAPWVTYVTPLMYNQGVVYQMLNGQKRPFLDTNAVTQNGYSPAQILPVENSVAGQPLGPLVPSADSTFRLANGIIMTYSGGRNIQVGSTDELYRWGLSGNYNPTPPASSWDTTSPAPDATLNSHFLASNSTPILVDGGRAIDLSAVASRWPTPPTADPAFTTLISRLTSLKATTTSCFITASGNIVWVENSQYRSVRLLADMYPLGCTPTSLIRIVDGSLNLLSQGPAKLSQNRLFQAANSPTIYMQTSDTSSVTVPSYDYVTAFAQTPGDIPTVDSATTANYVPGGTISSLAGNAGYQAYFLYTPATKYYFTSNDFANWGINKQTIQTYDNKIGSGMTARAATQFARTSDGKIYYGSGGSAHHVTSYDAFVRLGGQSGNVMPALADFIANLPAGADINQ